jgi:thiosulfate/3-mercaptopyruvate sulfurtransferase
MREIRRRPPEPSRTYRFVDCRWELGKPEVGRDLYLAGHIPGAAFLDVEEELSAPPVDGGARHPLPSEEAFAAAAGRAGIAPGVLVVAYGSMGGAERLWWLLRHFGHDDVAVLDGGIDSWLGPLASGDEEIEAAVFEPRARAGDTADADEIAEKLGSPTVAFVDARLPPRFRGEANPVDRVPGRLPGAVNVPWNQTGALPQSLLDSEEVIVYCGSGVTACVPLLALARAGRTDARLYSGSWSDWESRGLPVERS